MVTVEAGTVSASGRYVSYWNAFLFIPLRPNMWAVLLIFISILDSCLGRSSSDRRDSVYFTPSRTTGKS